MYKLLIKKRKPVRSKNEKEYCDSPAVGTGADDGHDRPGGSSGHREKGNWKRKSSQTWKCEGCNPGERRLTNSTCLFSDIAINLPPSSPSQELCFSKKNIIYNLILNLRSDSH